MKELIVHVTWPFNLESSFTSKFRSELEAKWFYVDKISDGSIGTKKCDCYIKTYNRTYLCEIKVIPDNIFHFSRLRPNQVKALRLWDKLWGESIVVVYSKKRDAYKIIPFHKIQHLSRDHAVEIDFINVIW